MIARSYLYAGAAVVGVGLLYVLAKKRPGESLAGSAGRAAVSAAGDVAAGAVKGVGEIFGIPDTNVSQCDADLAAGRTWAASFSCPASRFVAGVYNGTTFNAARIDDARQIDRIIERQQAAVGGLSGVYDPATGAEVGRYDEMGNRVY